MKQWWAVVAVGVGGFVAALAVVAAWMGRSAPGSPVQPTMKEEVG